MSDVRRVQIGEKRYVDSGTGWRMLIEKKGGGSVRLTPGEAGYVEEHARTVLPPVLPRRRRLDGTFESRRGLQGPRG